jgi:hypothetical protein
VFGSSKTDANVPIVQHEDREVTCHVLVSFEELKKTANLLTQTIFMPLAFTKVEMTNDGGPALIIPLDNGDCCRYLCQACRHLDYESAVRADDLAHTVALIGGQMDSEGCILASDRKLHSANDAGLRGEL